MGVGWGLRTHILLRNTPSTMVSSGLQTFLLHIPIRKIFEHTPPLCVYLCIYKLYTYIYLVLLLNIFQIQNKSRKEKNKCKYIWIFSSCTPVYSWGCLHHPGYLPMWLELVIHREFCYCVKAQKSAKLSQGSLGQFVDLWFRCQFLVLFN